MVKLHVEVNHVKDKRVVSNSSSSDKGPFVITTDIGNNSFKVQLNDELQYTTQNKKIGILFVPSGALPTATTKHH